jgi:hypothetical protein
VFNSDTFCEGGRAFEEARVDGGRMLEGTGASRVGECFNFKGSWGCGLENRGGERLSGALGICKGGVCLLICVTQARA